jgi:uncharacterized protein (DUF2141 family)
MISISFITSVWLNWSLAFAPSSNCSLAPQVQKDQNLILTATFDGAPNGKLYVAVFDSEKAWPDAGKAVKKMSFEVDKKSAGTFDLGKLPAGQYGISCFLDENKNGKLDQNWIGVPTEAYGFSKNVWPKYRPANWNEVVFKTTGDGHTEQVKLLKWRF